MLLLGFDKTKVLLLLLISGFCNKMLAYFEIPYMALPGEGFDDFVFCNRFPSMPKRDIIGILAG